MGKGLFREDQLRLRTVAIEMSSRNDLDLNEQIEEVRELLYDIVKKADAGVDSVLLAEEYQRQFVHTGIARPLPAAWLRYVKAADEFEVKQENGQTIISIVQQGQIPIPVLKDLSLISAPIIVDNGPVMVEQEMIELNPLPLSSMPTSKAKVHVLSATDPDNISIRLVSWDPLPDYLYSALSKDFTSETKSNTRVMPVDGLICVAKLSNGSWERVKIIGPSKLRGDKGFYVVYLVDVGIYHVVHAKNLQPVSASLHAFKNFLLAKCKLSNIKPANNKKLYGTDAQLALNQWLESEGQDIELIPVGEWSLTNEPIAVPFVSAKLMIDGEDIANKLVSLGFAEMSN